MVDAAALRDGLESLSKDVQEPVVDVGDKYPVDGEAVAYEFTLDAPKLDKRVASMVVADEGGQVYEFVVRLPSIGTTQIPGGAYERRLCEAVSQADPPCEMDVEIRFERERWDAHVEVTEWCEVNSADELTAWLERFVDEYRAEFEGEFEFLGASNGDERDLKPYDPTEEFA